MSKFLQVYKTLAVLLSFTCCAQPVLGLTLFNRTEDTLNVDVRSRDKNNNEKIDRFSLDKGAQKDLSIESCPSVVACLVSVENVEGPTHGKGELLLDNASKDLRYLITPGLPHGQYCITPA